MPFCVGVADVTLLSPSLEELLQLLLATILLIATQDLYGEPDACGLGKRPHHQRSACTGVCGFLPQDREADH